MNTNYTQSQIDDIKEREKKGPLSGVGEKATEFVSKMVYLQGIRQKLLSKNIALQLLGLSQSLAGTSCCILYGEIG